MTISLPFDSNTIGPRGKYGPRLWNGAQTFHTGVDFAVASNRPIVAAESGTVTEVAYTPLKGYQVEITHSASRRTRYHMVRKDADDIVFAGKAVQKGEIIAYVAPERYSSGAAWTGPHLHFEVWLKKTRSNGEAYESWFHWDPLKAVVNAGGSSGYSPLEPAGNSGTPLEPEEPETLYPNPLEIDMPKLIIAGPIGTGAIFWTDGATVWDPVTTATEAYELGRFSGQIRPGYSSNEQIRNELARNDALVSTGEGNRIRDKVLATQAWRNYGKSPAAAFVSETNTSIGATLKSILDESKKNPAAAIVSQLNTSLGQAVTNIWNKVSS